MNIAIILSGGSGSRLGSQIPKQYLCVNDMPIIKYCIDTLFSLIEIDAVHIVANEQWHNTVSTCIAEEYKAKFRGFSKPGINRQMSIYNALLDIEEYADYNDKIIIHDAARPFVKKNTIVELLNALDEYDGAIPVLPMKDTCYIVENNHIASLIDRNSLKAGQAPEGFTFGKYIAANRVLINDKINEINGSSEVAFLAGMNIKCINGDEGNIKITTKEDLIRWQNESI